MIIKKVANKKRNMLGILEPHNRVKNKNTEAYFKKPCSYKMKNVYYAMSAIIHDHFS